MKSIIRDDAIVFRQISILGPLVFLAWGISMWFLPIEGPGGVIEGAKGVFKEMPPLFFYILIRTTSLIVLWGAVASFRWNVLKIGAESIDYQYLYCLVRRRGSIPLSNVIDVSVDEKFRRKGRSECNQFRYRLVFHVRRKDTGQEVMVPGFVAGHYEYFQVQSLLGKITTPYGTRRGVPVKPTASYVDSEVPAESAGA